MQTQRRQIIWEICQNSNSLISLQEGGDVLNMKGNYKMSDKNRTVYRLSAGDLKHFQIFPQIAQKKVHAISRGCFQIGITEERV